MKASAKTARHLLPFALLLTITMGLSDNVIYAQGGDHVDSGNGNSDDNRTKNRRPGNPGRGLRRGPKILTEEDIQGRRLGNRGPHTTSVIVMPEDMTAEEARIIASHETSREEPKFSPSQRLDMARKQLNGHVIGQPELVEAFLDIEKQIAAEGIGTREKPVYVYAMGLPGTGKDTAAKAYTDLRNGPGGHTKHMYHLPVAKSKADMWKFFGSATGYIGSGALSDLVKWLVEHSGGRYQIVEGNGAPYVEEVADWRPGSEPPPGSFRPEDALLYLDEFHNWDREAKDSFLKQGLEKGMWPINNPGNGVSQIYVPITIMAASNEGIGLITNRDVNGNKIGESAPYDILLRRWESVAPNKRRLKKAIMTHGRGPRSAGQETQSGMSEELLDRIGDPRIVLTRPLSPADLKVIAEIKLKDYQLILEASEGEFGPVKIEWLLNVEKFLVDYRYDAEKGGRTVADNIDATIKKTLLDILYKHEFFSRSNQSQIIVFGVYPNEDKTFNLTYDIVINGEEKGRFEILIEDTVSHRPPRPMSEQQLAVLRRLPDEFKKRVFNMDGLAQQVANTLAMNEERANAGAAGDVAATPATAKLLLGLSSTGKTELAKVAAEVIGQVHGDDGQTLKIINFNGVQTEQQLKEIIYGVKGRFGEVVPSEFMQHHDQFGGKAIFLFDEIANAPRHVLRMLYDILREPIVTGFADDEPRSMSNTTIFMTGNAGESWFTEIPRNLPANELRRAMAEVYEQVQRDPGYQRKFLEEFFSPALLNRIGLQNIHVLAPHGFKSARQLAILKLDHALESLRPSESGIGWKISFLGESDYIALMNAVESDGFEPNEQGASIDRYAKVVFGEGLRMALQQEQAVPNGSEVILAHAGRVPSTPTEPAHHVFFGLLPEQDRTFEFKLAALPEPKVIRETAVESTLTAYHEAAHSLVSRVLLGDKWEGVKISIVHGVAKISNRWVLYEGIARSENYEQLAHIRSTVVQQMAVLLAGEQAEWLASGHASGGKSNDIVRATQLAYDAILKYGLSKAWGNEAQPQDISLTEYRASLSQGRRNLLEAEVRKLQTEARQLAFDTLVLNFKAGLEPLGVLLAEKGELDRDQLRDFYEDRVLRHPRQVNARTRWWAGLKARINTRLKTVTNVQERRQILAHVAKPAAIANIEELVEEWRQKEVADVALPENIPTPDENVTNLSPEVMDQYLRRARGLTERANAARGKLAAKCSGLFD